MLVGGALPSRRNAIAKASACLRHDHATFAAAVAILIALELGPVTTRTCATYARSCAALAVGRAASVIRRNAIDAEVVGRVTCVETTVGQRVAAATGRAADAEPKLRAIANVAT